MITETKPKRATYYEELVERGYSRRDFMKFCTMMAAYMGLQTTGAAGGRSTAKQATASGDLASLSGMHMLQRVVHTIIAPDGS